LGVVVLEAIMAIDVAAPFSEEITEDGPELTGMDKRVEVGDGPPANSPNPIHSLVMAGSHRILRNVPNTWDKSVFGNLIERNIGGFLKHVKEDR
jgi:hypothetical protein